MRRRRPGLLQHARGRGAGCPPARSRRAWAIAAGAKAGSAWKACALELRGASGVRLLRRGGERQRRRAARRAARAPAPRASRGCAARAAPAPRAARRRRAAPPRPRAPAPARRPSRRAPSPAAAGRASPRKRESSREARARNASSAASSRPDSRSASAVSSSICGVSPSAARALRTSSRAASAVPAASATSARVTAASPSARRRSRAARAHAPRPAAHRADRRKQAVQQQEGERPAPAARSGSWCRSRCRRRWISTVPPTSRQPHRERDAGREDEQGSMMARPHRLSPPPATGAARCAPRAARAPGRSSPASPRAPAAAACRCAEAPLQVARLQRAAGALDLRLGRVAPDHLLAAADGDQPAEPGQRPVHHPGAGCRPAAWRPRRRRRARPGPPPRRTAAATPRSAAPSARSGRGPAAAGRSAPGASPSGWPAEQRAAQPVDRGQARGAALQRRQPLLRRLQPRRGAVPSATLRAARAEPLPDLRSRPSRRCPRCSRWRPGAARAASPAPMRAAPPPARRRAALLLAGAASCRRRVGSASISWKRAVLASSRRQPLEPRGQRVEGGALGTAAGSKTGRPSTAVRRRSLAMARSAAWAALRSIAAAARSGAAIWPSSGRRSGGPGRSSRRAGAPPAGRVLQAGAQRGSLLAQPFQRVDRLSIRAEPRRVHARRRASRAAWSAATTAPPAARRRRRRSPRRPGPRAAARAGAWTAAGERGRGSRARRSSVLPRASVPGARPWAEESQQ